MKTLVTTVTERGQVSVPAEIRKTMHLKPGMRLIWQPVSDHECHVEVRRTPDRLGAMALRGYARRFRQTRRSAEWLHELREGDAG